MNDIAPLPSSRVSSSPAPQALGRTTGYSFRFLLFPLGLLTGLFEPERLVEAIRDGCQDGFRLIRREFTIERRRVLFLLSALGFGLIFRRSNAHPDVEHDWRVTIYKTRFFTRTVNVADMTSLLNQAAEGGFELFHALKYPTRFLFIFPRESYAFIFRRPFAGTHPKLTYTVKQVPYRFFTRTIDDHAYESTLNEQGHHSQLKITFRDERRVLGLLVQPTVVAIFERGGA